MSQVTNIILATSLGEDADYLVNKFKEFKMADRTPFNLVSVDNDFMPKGWYGGDKMIEANIFLGAYNHLNLNLLIDFMIKEVNWENPDYVQLFVKEQGDMSFKIIHLTINP